MVVENSVAPDVVVARYQQSNTSDAELAIEGNEVVNNDKIQIRGMS